MGKKQLKKNILPPTWKGEDIIAKIFLLFGLKQYTSVAKQTTVFPPATNATEYT